MLPAEYDDVSHIKDDSLYKVTKDGKYGLYDSESKQFILPMEYDDTTFIDEKIDELVNH